MTTENLIIASYFISIILVGSISINSYSRMRKAEDILQDLKERP